MIGAKTGVEILILLSALSFISLMVLVYSISDGRTIELIHGVNKSKCPIISPKLRMIILKSHNSRLIIDYITVQKYFSWSYGHIDK